MFQMENQRDQVFQEKLIKPILLKVSKKSRANLSQRSRRKRRKNNLKINPKISPKKNLKNNNLMREYQNKKIY